MSRITRRRLGALLLITAGLTALMIPFLFYGPSPSGTTPPPPGGGTTPPTSESGAGGGGSTGAGSGVQDTSPPQTTATITAPFDFPREGNIYYYPNFTITFHAVDDMNLSKLSLNDTGSVHTWNVSGITANVTWTATSPGFHELTYWSVDKAGNREAPHATTARLAKPDFGDLLRLIANSHIDNPGIKNALSVKAEHAQDEQAAGQNPTALDPLANQISALSGKQGLDQDLANTLLAIIKIIIG